MEPTLGTWIETLDDGTLYFSKVSSNHKELKDKDKSKKEFEHTEANSVLDFTEGKDELDSGKKYLHKELNQIVIINSIQRDENDNPTKYIVGVEGKEDTIELTSEQAQVLDKHVDANIRVLSKSGLKNTVRGSIKVNERLINSVKDMLALTGLNPNSYKFLKRKDKEEDKLEIAKDADVSSLYDPKAGISLFALESLGKPYKWKRFAEVYESSEWSCSGYSADGLIFKPTKDILLAGFAAYGPKNDPSYWMRYKVEINDKVVKEQMQEKEYTKFVDKYYNPIYYN